MGKTVWKDIFTYKGYTIYKSFPFPWEHESAFVKCCNCGEKKKAEHFYDVDFGRVALCDSCYLTLEAAGKAAGITDNPVLKIILVTLVDQMKEPVGILPEMSDRKGSTQQINLKLTPRVNRHERRRLAALARKRR